MFSKILIANRGEIACRIIKTAKRLGIRTVAVFSDADRHALHTQLADEAIHVGAPASSESYLVADRIVKAALTTNAQAIHPGYGFLSENAAFAQLCADNNLVFIGPPVLAIDAMGSKSAAKTIMEKASVPLVPGYHGEEQDPQRLKQAADDMGYPVLLKAVAGGGGKGMRQVWSVDEFGSALTQAKNEAKTSFGDDKMLVEKYLTQPRHVEVQVFCDTQGNGVYLFERDCSVQRRHQKIIEEAPAPNLGDDVRREMGNAAIKAAQAISYEGAGTVEFLYDTDGSFYFMEMNTRLQVEHPVTEMITGQDLVEWQLRIADGEPLPLQQAELKLDGHSFEARIYAEDPNNDFLPTSGTLHHLNSPAQNRHVRVDTGVLEGDEVSPYYDPMIAKLVVWDEDRTRALTRLANALSEYQISGVTTNISFLYDLATHPAFVDAELTTGFIETHKNTLFKRTNKPSDHTLALIGLTLVLQQLNQNIDENTPWADCSGWRLNQPNQLNYAILINGELNTVTATEHKGRTYKIAVNGSVAIAQGSLDDKKIIAEIDGHRHTATLSHHAGHYTLFTAQDTIEFELASPDLGDDESLTSKGEFAAPMNGTVVEVFVSAGSTVTKGDSLVVMEAMKMQHTIKAPSDGTIEDVFCAKDELVDGGTELLSFAPKSKG